jgi:hypothetical protein
VFDLLWGTFEEPSSFDIASTFSDDKRAKEIMNNKNLFIKDHKR